MCGIVGIARLGNLELFEKDREVFMQLLHTGVVRGHHGTGIFAIGRDGGARLVKSAGPPYMLMLAPEFAQFWTTTKAERAHILVGHNRFATTGKKISKHAHPFIHKDIVMVHNGGVENVKDFPEAKDLEVDSEILCHSIATAGIDKTIPRVQGAYAIVYWDKKEQTLNMIRNTERPLHITIDEQLDRVMFASEPEMLSWILKRNYYDTPASVIKTYQLPVDTLWTFKFGSHTPEARSLAGKARPNYVYQGYTGDYYKNQEWDAVKGKWVAKNQELAFEVEDEQQRVIDAFFNGLKMSAPQKPEAAKRPSANSAIMALPSPKSAERHDPRRREVFVNSKEYIVTSELTNKDKTQVLKKGDQLTVLVNDYVPENSSKQLYIAIAAHDDWPECRFQFRVDSDGMLDAIFEAAVVNVTIQNIMEPGKNCENTETIIWANRPVVVADTPPDLILPTIH